MPTTFFPLSYLQRLTNATGEQLEQQAFDYGLEAMLKDDVLEVEVTAERPDLLSAEGFTRAINIYNGQPRTVPQQLEASGRRAIVDARVRSLRPYIGALVVERLELDESGVDALIQFQEKVAQTFGRQRKKMAIGIYDLSKIQGDLSYTVTESDRLRFTPLDGTAELSARQILTEHPNGIAYAHVIPSPDLVLVLKDAADHLLSMPPIINAEGIGRIDAQVSQLFIDVTGTSARTVLEMVNILAHNFIDLGAQVKTVEIVFPDEECITPDLTPKEIPFSAKFLNEIVGTAILKTDLNRYLARMDLQDTGRNTIVIPSYRTDILSEVDVAGDLLVAVGLDQLTADLSDLRFYTGKSDPLKDFVYRVGDFAQRMGLMEVKSFVLSDPDILNYFTTRYLQTENAKTKTYSAIRSSLQPGLLEILSRNIQAPKPINLYEMGEVITYTDGEKNLKECIHWGFASLDAQASFNTAKSYLQTLLKAFDLHYELVSCDATYYIPGRAASIQINGEIVGEFGEIHPEILHHFSFPEPVCAGELNCDALQQYSKRN
jgi:phenylalanyl-tRNA synthetase beta chain